MARLRTLQLEDIFKLRAVGRAVFDPTGAQIVFEEKCPNPAENKNFTHLYAVNAHGKRVRALTQGKHSNTLPKFSPDGTRLAFISTRDKVACLYTMSMDGGEPTRVTDLDANVSDFDWAPDSKRFVYVARPLNAREKLERDDKQDDLKQRPQFMHYSHLHHKLDGAGWWSGEWSHVYSIGAQGGRATQLTDGAVHDSEPRFSPDGKRIAFVSCRDHEADRWSGQSDAYVIPVRGGKPKRITQMDGEVMALRWSRDGEQIAFVGCSARPAHEWKENLHIWIVGAGGGKPVNLTPNLDNEVTNSVIGDVGGAMFDAQAPFFTDDDQQLIFQVTSRGCCHLYRVPRKGGRLEQLHDDEVNVAFADYCAETDQLALTIGTWENPGDVFVAPASLETPPVQLTRRNAALLDKVTLAQREPMDVKNGEHTVQGWLLKPPGFTARKKYPAILEVHGGPMTAYGAGFFHEMQWLAAQGYVVAYSNPRGSSSYGKQFRNCIHGRWGTYDYDDVKKFADRLFRQSFVDSKRVGITGGSYGGYMTNWVLAKEHRFKAGCTQRCVSNFESMFGTSDFGFELGVLFGGVPWEKEKAFRAQAPITFAHKIKTPLLVVHSMEDHRCPYEQALQMFTTLKVQGVETELVLFEGESHGLSRGGRPQNRGERLRQLQRWFDRHLKG